MNKSLLILSIAVSSFLAGGVVDAAKLMSVSYGTITGVNQQERDTSGGKSGGALVGGLVGLYTGKGKSGRNKALRTLGGAAVGSAATPTHSPIPWRRPASADPAPPDTDANEPGSARLQPEPTR